MRSALYTMLPNDPLKRINRTNATNKVLFYALSNSMRVVGLESTIFIRRDNPCRTVFTGSQKQCESFKNNRHE